MNIILRLLQELEQEILSCGTAIWSKRVDAEKCLSLIGKIAASLPRTLSEADVIVSEKARIIDSAQKQANEILAKAEQQAYSSVSVSSVAKLAETQAKRLRDSAERECEVLATQTKAEIASMYDDFEKHVLEILNLTRRSRKVYSPGESEYRPRKKSQSR